MSFKSWWRNENYDPEHMRRFREARPDWADLPDEIVAQSFTFAGFALGEAVRDAWAELRKIPPFSWIPGDSE